MIQADRRGVLAGAMALCVAAPLGATPALRPVVLLHDPTLAAGRRFAAAAAGADLRVLAGDRVRLMRGVLAGRPAMVAGVSRPADALLIADVARDHGYVRAAELGADCGWCRPGWAALERMARQAGVGWVEVLAQHATGAAPVAIGAARDRGLVLGWLLVPGDGAGKGG